MKKNRKARINCLPVQQRKCHNQVAVSAETDACEPGTCADDIRGYGMVPLAPPGEWVNSCSVAKIRRLSVPRGTFPVHQTLVTYISLLSDQLQH
jgi:hypothetical protein